MSPPDQALQATAGKPSQLEGCAIKMVLKARWTCPTSPAEELFAAWEREGVFQPVKLCHHGQIEWRGDLDLCPDALYRTLTGRRPIEPLP